MHHHHDIDHNPQFKSIDSTRATSETNLNKDHNYIDNNFHNEEHHLLKDKDNNHDNGYEHSKNKKFY